MAAPLPLMLTANRLNDGAVLYWRQGSWIESFSEAEIFRESARAEAALAAAQDFVARNLVVTPYLFEVRDGEGGSEPVKEREVIRARGPSVLRTQKSEVRNQKSEAIEYEI